MSPSKKYSFDPDYAVPPGASLQETMEALDMTQKELALRTGLTVVTLNRIFKGEQPISYETANRLELVTGTPANFWNKLEAQYQEQRAKVQERRRLESDQEWLKTIPTKELAERGFLRQSTNKVELLRETLAFYGVSSVKAWRDIWEEPAVAARRSHCFESQIGPASAWIRQGEIQAHGTNCQPHDKKRFEEALKTIRGLTRTSPEVFEPKMRRLCAEAGVAVTFVKEMKKVPWCGATKWLSPRKAMILLNLRGKGSDIFWFSFFHEAGHVLHDGKKDLLINDGSKDDPREVRADRFAVEFLIPSHYDSAIKSFRSKREVVSLAKDLGISPAIVVGRYQHITKKWHYFKELITPLKWAE